MLDNDKTYVLVTITLTRFLGIVKEILNTLE